MAPKKPKVKKKLSDYNRFIKTELKGKTGPGYKARFKAAVAKWKRSPKGRASRARAGKPPQRQKRLSGGPPKTRARSRTTRAKATPSGGRKMAGFNTQKIMKYIRLGALAAPYVGVAMDPALSGQTKVYRGIAYATGVDLATGKFSLANLAKGWLPYLASIGVTYGVPKLAGIIRGL